MGSIKTKLSSVLESDILIRMKGSPFCTFFCKSCQKAAALEELLDLVAVPPSPWLSADSGSELVFSVDENPPVEEEGIAGK